MTGMPSMARIRSGQPPWLGTGSPQPETAAVIDAIASPPADHVGRHDQR
jgi:hypothetical protein